MKQKTKNIVLIAVLLCILFVAYRFSIAKTFAIHSEVSKLEYEKEKYLAAPIQLAALKKKEQQLEAILRKNNLKGSSLQHNLLKTLNSLSNMSEIKVIAFEEPHIYDDEVTKEEITTYDFILQGDYKALIEVIYALEQQYSFGNIVQVHFEKKKNFRTGVTYLQCRVLLQRLN
ncbi:hypothetical protein ACFSTE_13530 [Aquimarina hainanensis]|uniref:Tfp pilus assembly protein PilO n=1 Tax=Aquimarina hainanensis TaxID=1578017 RepID=A0ABW5N9X3_9FLAO|nr:hypothetical protein [Aquimarina sp. TRL1]QKX04092.1 hypothetical protein HN014_03935 [Aquimarina sp. TRL1]